MRIAVIDALELHPSERIHGRRAARFRAPGQAQPPLLTLLRDLAVVVATSLVCWIVVGG